MSVSSVTSVGASVVTGWHKANIKVNAKANAKVNAHGMRAASQQIRIRWRVAQDR